MCRQGSPLLADYYFFRLLSFLSFLSSGILANQKKHRHSLLYTILALMTHPIYTL